MPNIEAALTLIFPLCLFERSATLWTEYIGLDWLWLFREIKGYISVLREL